MIQSMTLDCSQSPSPWTALLGLSKRNPATQLTSITISRLRLSDVPPREFLWSLRQIPSTCKIYLPSIRAQMLPRVNHLLDNLPSQVEYTRLSPSKISNLLAVPTQGNKDPNSTGSKQCYQKSKIAHLSAAFHDLDDTEPSKVRELQKNHQRI